MIRFFLAAMLVLGTLGSVAWRLARHLESKPIVPREWLMEPLERQSSRGISERVGLVRQEIAQIASGDPALAQRLYNLAGAVQALDRDDAELRLEAARVRHLDVEIAAVGTRWVEVVR